MSNGSAGGLEILGKTATWTAAVRSLESARTDALFQDPYARKLAGETGLTWLNQRSPLTVLPIVIRTKFFDDWLMSCTGNESVRQVVFPGAGLDTRAFRLDWPAGTVVFELDQPEVLAYKNNIISGQNGKNCRRVVVAADLRDSWREALVNAGFEPSRPSLWLLEGFLFYLDPASITAILDSVSELACPGSGLGFDIINSEMLRSPLTRDWVEMQAKSGAPWLGTMDDPVNFVGTRGWAAELSQAGAENAEYGRWPYPVIPVEMPSMPHNWYVTAAKIR